MEQKRFQKTKEDFTCEQCGASVEGTGYTNHCPHCLWSKHVDIHPGDRAESCGGMMEPIHVAQKGGEYELRHRCVVCKFEINKKVEEGDNFDAVLKLMMQQDIETK